MTELITSEPQITYLTLASIYCDFIKISDNNKCVPFAENEIDTHMNSSVIISNKSSIRMLLLTMYDLGQQNVLLIFKDNKLSMKFRGYDIPVTIFENTINNIVCAIDLNQLNDSLIFVSGECIKITICNGGLHINGINKPMGG